MKQIGFIGVYDKKDLLLNVAKIITKLNKSVLLIDATMMQRLRYIIPRISSTPTYISEYDGIDVAVGFMNLMGIASYLGTNKINYDYVLIDTDNPQTLNSFMLHNSFMNFYVTSYDEFELKKSMEILAGLRTNIKLTKLIVSADINNKHDGYLNHLLEKFPIEWNKEKILFADEDEDRGVDLANQLSKQINIKDYKSSYKDSLEYLISIMMQEVDQLSIRRIIRKK